MGKCVGADVPVRGHVRVRAMKCPRVSRGRRRYFYRVVHRVPVLNSVKAPACLVMDLC